MRAVKFLKSALNISLGFGVLFFYQNCGKGFETASLDGESSLLSLSIPALTWSTRPQAVNNNQIHSFQMALSAPYSRGVEYYCKVDMAPVFTVCAQQFNLNGLSDGVHEVSVKAVDTGNPAVESPIARYTWTQDRALPVVTVNQAPPATLGLTQAQVMFSAMDGLSGLDKYECSLNSVPYSACVSPLSLTNLIAGNYSLNIRAYDKAGNISAVSTLSWKVDLSVPTVTVNAKPNAIVMTRNNSVAFSGVDLTKYECKLGNAAFATCTSPVNYTNQVDGSYIFTVRGYNAGNKVSSDVAVNWVVDGTAPVLTLTTVPAAVITQNSASFAFTVVDAGSGVKTTTCQLDSQAAEACTTAKSYAALASGNHIFKLVAVDNAGNTSSKEHSFKYEAPVLDGKILYANNCAGCHNALVESTKLGRTAAQIQSAIGAIPNMASLKTMPAAEVSAIASALASTSTKYKCVSPALAGTTNPGARRLTKAEISNTIQYVLGATIFNDSAVQTKLSTLPEDQLKKNVTEYLPNAPIDYLLALTTISERAVTLADGNATIKTALFGACSSNPDANCAKTFIETFGKKVHRRPVTAAELADYQSTFSTFGGIKGLYYVFYQMMQAPSFVFHVEAGTGTGERIRLTDYEVASRIAYMTTGSPPDQTLMEAAGRVNELQNLANVKTQVDRLLASNSVMAKSQISRLMSYYATLSTVVDPYQGAGNLHQIVTSGLAEEYKKEAQEYMAYQFWDANANFAQLMTSRKSFPRSDTLQYVLGSAAKVGANNQPVDADADHLGLLHRPALLAAVQSRTSPILRGAHIRTRWLCDVIADPPSDAASFVSSLGDIENMTNREKVNKMTAPATCQACHSQLNPVGFAFEGFDQLGVKRARETAFRTDGSQVGVFNVDTSVSDPNIDGSGQGAADSKVLVNQIATSTKGRACFAQKVFEYTRLRQVSSSDYCGLEAAEKAASTGSLRDVVVNAIATEDIFWRK